MAEEERCKLCGEPCPDDGLVRRYRVRTEEVSPLCPGCAATIDDALTQAVKRLRKNKALDRPTLETSHRLLNELAKAACDPYSRGVIGAPIIAMLTRVDAHLEVCRELLENAETGPNL